MHLVSNQARSFLIFPSLTPPFNWIHIQSICKSYWLNLQNILWGCNQGMLGCVFIWRLNWKESEFKLIQVVGRIHFIEAVWLRGLTFCWLLAEGCYQVIVPCTEQILLKESGFHPQVKGTIFYSDFMVIYIQGTLAFQVEKRMVYQIDQFVLTGLCSIADRKFLTIQRVRYPYF